MSPAPKHMAPTSLGIRPFLRAAFAFSPERKTPWFFRVRRHLRRSRRALFGPRLPHWAKGLREFAGFFNALELIPTLIVLFLYPWHLFRRLPQVLAGNKPWYKLPMTFFLIQAISVVWLDAVFDTGVKNAAALPFPTLLPGWLPATFRNAAAAKESILFDAIFVMLTPLWLTIVALFAAFTTFAYEYARTSEHGPFRRFVLTILNPYLYLILLSFQTYRRISWSRLIWSLFYFALVAALLSIAFFLALGFSLDYVHMPESVYVCTFVLLAFQRILVGPYIALLRSARPTPTILMHKSDVYVFMEILANIERRQYTWFTGQPINAGALDRALDRFLLWCACRSWERYYNRARTEHYDLARVSPEHAAATLRDARSVLNDQFDTAQVCQIVNRISAGTQLQERRVRMLNDFAKWSGHPMPLARTDGKAQPRGFHPAQVWTPLIGHTVVVQSARSIEIRSVRDLSAAVIRRAEGGERLRLREISETDGREWVKAEMEDGSQGHALASSVRSRCDGLFCRDEPLSLRIPQLLENTAQLDHLNSLSGSEMVENLLAVFDDKSGGASATEKGGRIQNESADALLKKERHAQEQREAVEIERSRRELRRLRALVAVLASALISVSIAGLFVWQQMRKADFATRNSTSPVLVAGGAEHVAGAAQVQAKAPGSAAAGAPVPHDYASELENQAARYRQKTNAPAKGTSSSASSLDLLNPTANKRSISSGIQSEVKKFERYNLYWFDPFTGLMWSKTDTPSNISRAGPVEYCRDLRLLGFTDWRSPTIDELQKLYQPGENVYAQRIKSDLDLAGFAFEKKQGGLAVGVPGGTVLCVRPGSR